MNGSFRAWTVAIAVFVVVPMALGADRGGYRLVWADPLKPADVGLLGENFFKPGMCDWSVTHGLYGSPSSASGLTPGTDRISVQRAPDGRPAIQSVSSAKGSPLWGFRAPVVRPPLRMAMAEVDIWIPSQLTWNENHQLALGVWGGGRALSAYGGDILPAQQDGFAVGVAYSRSRGLQLYSFHLNRNQPIQADGSMPPALSAESGGVLPTGRWVTLALEVSMNDGDRPNGWARLSVDGEVHVEMNGLVFATAERTWAIRGLLLQDHWGGAGADPAARGPPLPYWYSRYRLFTRTAQ